MSLLEPYRVWDRGLEPPEPDEHEDEQTQDEPEEDLDVDAILARRDWP